MHLRLKFRLQVRRHQDDAVRGTGLNVLPPSAFRRDLVVDRRNHRADAGIVRDILDTTNDLDRPRAVEIVEYQVDEIGVRTFAEAAALVVVLLEELLDAGSGVRCDVESTVEDARHGGHRHACLCGDGGDGDPSHPPSIGDGHGESSFESLIQRYASNADPQLRNRRGKALLHRDVGHHAP